MSTINDMYESYHIYLFAILRASDLSIVASFQQDPSVTCEGVRECIAGSPNIQTGKRYTSQGSYQSIHFMIDAPGRVYAVVTSTKYSPRLAFAALEELVGRFINELGDKVAGVGEGGLSTAAKPMMRDIYSK